jgi:hypothetical protein
VNGSNYPGCRLRRRRRLTDRNLTNRPATIGTVTSADGSGTTVCCAIIFTVPEVLVNGTADSSTPFSSTRSKKVNGELGSFCDPDAEMGARLTVNWSLT